MSAKVKPGTKSRFAIIMTVFLCAVTTAKASLMAYEGFAYLAGDSLTNSSAQGAGGSFGWANRWAASSTSNATNYPVSLGYTDSQGNTLTTNGGSVVIGFTNGSTINSQPSRSFNFGTLNGNTYSGLTNSVATYWMSFVMQWAGSVTAGSTTNQYGRKGDLCFRAGINTNAASGGTALYNVGSPNANNRIGTPYDTWTTWTGNDAGAGTQNTGLAAAGSSPLNVPTFVLVRIDLNGTAAADTVYTWFNWTNLDVEPPISTANTTNNTANQDGLNNIRLDANGGNATGTNTVLLFDEFRFGNSFADVTPHSSGFIQPPVINVQPVNVSTTETYPASFSITVAGADPLHYQWYFNTNTPIGLNTNVLAIASVQQSDAGAYQCIVTNAGGSVTSSVAMLTVLAPVLPQITAQPDNYTNAVGFPASFSVTATGSAPLSYQWYFNTNTVLSNSTNSTLSFTISSTNDAGVYSVLVTNKFGQVTSDFVTLTIYPFGPGQLPAFPGADGAGQFASGGRGGIVYHVTKLDRNFGDTSIGTLRYGLTDANFPANTPRTIVFDVAGTFWLGLYGAERPEYDNGWDAQSVYNIPKNVTLAGQSAPGPVIIMGGVTKSGGTNVIIRNITFAPGYGMRGFNEPDKVPPTVPTPGDFPDSSIFDALEVNGQNVMLDHLTMLYGTAGTMWFRDQASNLTMQYCTLAQAQNYPQADPNNTTQYRGLGFGSDFQGGSNGKISYVNNLSAHLYLHFFMSGSVGGNFNDFRNDVFYNWQTRTLSSPGGLQSWNNFINNFYLAGPGGDGVSGTNIIFVPGSTGIFNGTGASETHAFVSGNLKDINTNGSPYDTLSADGDYLSTGFQPSAYNVNIGVTLPTAAGFTNVLHYTGARWWARPYDFALGNTNAISTNDIAAYIDQRLIMETVTGTGKIKAWADDPFDNSPSEGWEWRALLALRADTNTFSAPFNRPANWDTDGDGMPDAWEIEHGLDPNVANSNGDFDNDGYTDLEKYLNEVAAWPAPGQIVFTGEENSRYARIFNWRVYGAQVNITNIGNTATFSYWQPSRYDTAIISNSTCVVDAVGQHAGTLCLSSNATLNITNGWLNVANKVEIGTNCTIAVQGTGSLRVTNNIVNNGILRLTGSAGLVIGGSITNNGVLDVMTWSGMLPAIVNYGVVLDPSLVKADSANMDGTNFVVTIQGYVGHNYQLQYRDDLSTSTWTDIGSLVSGNNAPVVLTHTNGATAGQRFYRVAVNP